MRQQKKKISKLRLYNGEGTGGRERPNLRESTGPEHLKTNRGIVLQREKGRGCIDLAKGVGGRLLFSRARARSGGKGVDQEGEEGAGGGF